MGHPGQLAAPHHADYRQTGSVIHRPASLATPQFNPQVNPGRRYAGEKRQWSRRATDRQPARAPARSARAAPARSARVVAFAQPAWSRRRSTRSAGVVTGRSQTNPRQT
nr:hypothetical protein Ade03nite_89720 [Actinoplanes derwentensis]